jgi:hypothetical protein
MDAQRLSGFELDVAVLRAMGLTVVGDATIACGMHEGVALAVVGNPRGNPFLHSPSEQWDIGGRLIEANGISLHFDGTLWQARCRSAGGEGSTPLIAAMRALVAEGGAHLGPDRRRRARELGLVAEALWSTAFSRPRRTR